MNYEKKCKVLVMKVPLFLLKNALGQRYQHFSIFFRGQPLVAIPTTFNAKKYFFSPKILIWV